MLGSTPMIHALGSGPLRLVAPGALAAAFTFSRPSTGQALAADGATWQSYAAHAPRFHGTARRLLVAGDRTNAITNPRAEGAAAGTRPTGWSIANSSTLGVACNGPVAANGMTGIEVAVTGEAASAGSVRVNLGNAAFSIPAGGSSAFSVSHQLVSGVGLSGVQLRATNSALNSIAVASPAPAIARVSAVHGYASAQTTSAVGYVIAFGAGTVNIVLRLFWPQFEPNAAFASSPIVPAAGSPAASTRAADAPVLPLGQTQGTLVGTFLLAQPAPAGTEQGLLQLDDGTDANRIVLRNPAGGSAVEAALVSAGAAGPVLSGGGMTPGIPFRAALAWGGGVALCVSGGAVQSTAGLPAGIGRLLVGHGNAALTRAAFGEVGPLELHRVRLPDSALQSLTAA